MQETNYLHEIWKKMKKLQCNGCENLYDKDLHTPELLFCAPCPYSQTFCSQCVGKPRTCKCNQEFPIDPEYPVNDEVLKKIDKLYSKIIERKSEIYQQLTELIEVLKWFSHLEITNLKRKEEEFQSYVESKEDETLQLRVQMRYTYARDQDLILTNSRNLLFVKYRDLLLTDDQKLRLENNQELQLTSDQELLLTKYQALLLSRDQELQKLLLTKDQDFQDLLLTRHHNFQDLLLDKHQDLVLASHQDLQNLLLARDRELHESLLAMDNDLLLADNLGDFQKYKNSIGSHSFHLLNEYLQKLASLNNAYDTLKSEPCRFVQENFDKQQDIYSQTLSSLKERFGGQNGNIGNVREPISQGNQNEGERKKGAQKQRKIIKKEKGSKNSTTNKVASKSAGSNKKFRVNRNGRKDLSNRNENDEEDPLYQDDEDSGDPPFENDDKENNNEEKEFLGRNQNGEIHQDQEGFKREEWRRRLRNRDKNNFVAFLNVNNSTRMNVEDTGENQSLEERLYE